MHAELSSVSATISTTKDRVAKMAEGLHSEHEAELRSALEEVERSLRTCGRLLERATRIARQRSR